MSTKQSVLAIGPNGGAHIYSSASAAARVLSGNGTRSKIMSVTRRLNEGGGYVGNVWVQTTGLDGISRS